MTAPNLFASAIPDDPPDDILDWAEAHVRLKGSVRSEHFDRSISPWIVDPIRWMFDGVTRRTTFIKPVQSGGSAAGLITLCGWLKWRYGFIQYNWEKDDKATNKWEEIIVPTLRACDDLDWAGGRFDEKVGKAQFRQSFVRCQGVFNPANLDSDSVPLQLNEEVHSWKPGHLAKARARQTAVWNPKAMDISNAGETGSQLEQAWSEGTMQHWEVKCPGCGLYHAIRTRWEDDKPHMGGLRYDTEGCKRDGGTFDYNKLRSTIYFQMPCGFKVHDHVTERRPLSLSGRYGEPTNTGCDLSLRSCTLDAVSVDFIPWLQLIQEKHSALRALNNGDQEPYRRYITERECRFWDREDRPLVGRVVLSPTVKKSRTGLTNHPDFAARFFAFDYQKGFKRLGQNRHYWGVIRDVLQNCDSQLVWEGMVETEGDILALLDGHECQRRCGVIDATFDPDHVRDFCYRNGINTTVGGKSTGYYTHTDKTIHVYSEEKPLHTVMGSQPKFNYVVRNGLYVPASEEPLEWFYHKYGIMSRLEWLRNNPVIKFEVPDDVSKDYKEQCESWVYEEERKGKSKEVVQMWKQVRRADHLYSCETYIAMLMDMSGLLGRRLTQLGMTDLLGINLGVEPDHEG